MAEPPLSRAEAKKRYLVFLVVRLFGLAIMALGAWLGRDHGQAIGMGVILLGGLTLFIRPRHLGLTRR
jgi:hypothetical protein